MKLHVFNPEHDLALACNTKNYTPSEGIRNMRCSLSYLPVFWAGDGDVILTDDIEATIAAKDAIGIAGNDVNFCTLKDIDKYDFDEIVPWGWDKALKHTLLRSGINSKLLPSDEKLEDIRSLSHRRNVIPLLQTLRNEFRSSTCGECMECTSEEQISNAIERWKRIVIKAPWSSSGINIIYVDDGGNDKLFARCRSLISKQGSVLAEPLYNKVKDFAMEFYSDGRGSVKYMGLSIFDTIGTAYLNNVIASESTKQNMLAEYITSDMLDRIKETICAYTSVRYGTAYRGPFGVDMMAATENDKLVIDPCVEINLRMTMGHAAIKRWEYMQKKGIRA